MEKKLSFKQKMMVMREELIIETVIHLLSTKGYDAMTVDEVADSVGIAKPSLYRHFPSKEALAIGALLDTMGKTEQEIKALNEDETLTPLDKLQRLTVWAMRLKLQQQMPNLPSENSVLVEQLKQSKAYTDGLIDISEELGGWIEAAQADGSLDDKIPSIVVLYTLYARACDPVLAFLKQGDLFSDDEIIEHVMRTCFSGLLHG